MERFNVAIPTDEDFPQVICAQRRGEDFQTEYVEYVPRWKVDGFMVVDKSAFFALADTAGRLERMNAELREWCSDFWKWADPPFALKSGTFDEYMTLVERAMKLGIEVDE